MKIYNAKNYNQAYLTKQLNICGKQLKNTKSQEKIKRVQENLTYLEELAVQYKPNRIKWLSLKNQAKQKLEMLASRQENPLAEKQKEKRTSLLPYAGLGIGCLAGLAKRCVDGLPFDEKNKALAKVVFQEWPALQGVNSLKQLEVKYFSLLAPLLPLAIQIVQDALENKTGLQEAIKKYATKEQAVYLSAALLGMAAVTCSAEYTADGFDPSGHMMLKMLLASLTAQTLRSMEDSKVSKAFSWAYGAHAIADAAFIYVTVSVCHTAAETVAGVAAAYALSQVARLAINRVSNH